MLIRSLIMLALRNVLRHLRHSVFSLAAIAAGVAALALAALAALALMRFRLGVNPVIAACALVGLLLRAAGLA